MEEAPLGSLPRIFTRRLLVISLGWIFFQRVGSIYQEDKLDAMLRRLKEKMLKWISEGAEGGKCREKKADLLDVNSNIDDYPKSGHSYE